MPAMRVALSLAACLALIAAGCQASPTPTPSATIGVTDLSSIRLATPSPPPRPAGSPVATTTSSRPRTDSPSAISIPLASPTPAATGPLAVATPYEGCINGWISPGRGSTEYLGALAMLNSQMDVNGDWAIDEMRYFTGPDVPWILDPHYDVVDYWYVRGSLTSQPGFSGRWLLEQRTELIHGISAVAPYTSRGYQSPDWTGFTGDGPPQAYLGLPGQWAGVPYDFVTGQGDSGQPGLPDQVISCLSGT